MRAKTLIELLTLSTNLYMISKDEGFMENLSEMTKKGKQKIDDFIGEFSDEKDVGKKLIEKFLDKAKQAKEELEQKMEKVAVEVYKKMHIAHTDDLKDVLQRLEVMEKKLSLAETQIANLSARNS